MEELKHKAELSSAKLRRVVRIGFASDVIVAGILLIMKDSLGLGDLVYYLAIYIVVAGLAMFFLLPRLPLMALARKQREQDLKMIEWKKSD